MASRRLVAKTTRWSGCFAAAFIFGAMLSAVAPAIGGGERFDFVAAGDRLGWGQTHNCTLQAAAGKPLVVRSTGEDPFFYSPRVSLRGARPGELVMRASFEGPVSHVSVYFATATEPNTDERKVMRVPIRADGEEHEVRIPVGRHGKWRGTITRYRFDLDPGMQAGAVMRLASVGYTFPAEPRLGDVRSSASVLAPAGSCPISVAIENVTPNELTDCEIRFQPHGDAIAVEPSSIKVGPLKSDETRRVRATVRAKANGVATLDVILMHAGKEVERHCTAFCVSPGGPAPKGLAMSSWSAGRPWAMKEVGYTQSLGIGLGEYSGLAEWWAWDKQRRPVRAGRIFPLVSLLHGKDTKRLEVVRWLPPSEKERKSSFIRLVGEMGSGPDKVADVEARFLGRVEGPDWIRVIVTLTATRTLYLRNFTSPRLLVGDGAFGDARDEGLFPGLEYLEKGERSSSKLDYHTPEYLRTVPHPKKITYPLMAITQGNRLFMLRWDFPEPDGDGFRAPAAGFASPNFVDGQKNHLMTLFWPSVPNVVPENRWEAATPVEMKPGEQLKLSYRLNVAPQALVDKPEIHVTDAYPIAFYSPRDKPRIAEAPRSDNKARALCRVAYTDTCWREEARGWNHALPARGGQWAPSPYTFNIQFLEAERAVMPPGAERDRVDEVLEKALAHAMEMRGKRPGADDYFFVGEWIVSCADARAGRARSLMRRQRADGSWGFQPGDARRAELGPRGKAEVGIVADAAMHILGYALMTGDREAEAAGLRALEHMKQYVIPRAAQVWEIPLHTPDVMGSARAATAYRLGYELTGDKKYLDRVQYWLDTALPFVYLWGHDRWPYWLNATTPVFGATHFRAPNWIGLPVQWCGLVYAEEALRAPGGAWFDVHREIAKGVVHSGMWQQPTEGEFRGTLPDSYNFAVTKGNGPFINPETILRPYCLMRGYDFRVNSVVVPRGADRSFRLSARAKIADAKVGANGELKATLGQVANLPFGVLLCGLDAEPRQVLWQNKPVLKRERLERDTPGWQYLADRKWLAVNLIGTGNQADLIVDAGR